MGKGCAVMLWLALLLGCDTGPQPAPERKPEQAPGAEAKPAKSQAEWDREWEAWQQSIVLPVEPRHRRLALTPEWLAGYWASGKAACLGSDSGIWLERDGHYRNHEESGLWSIANGQARFRVTEIYNAPDEPVGEVSRARLRLVGPNEIDWIESGEVSRLYRCPEGGLKLP